MSTTTINQKLQMTASEYDDMVFKSYLRWCESVSLNAQELQKILANSSISRWYMTEYTKLEVEFMQLTGSFEICETITKCDFKTCYKNCTIQMFNIRPMPLLQEAKKMEYKASNFLNHN
jgi:hypothetical protein